MGRDCEGIRRGNQGATGSQSGAATNHRFTHSHLHEGGRHLRQALDFALQDGQALDENL